MKLKLAIIVTMVALFVGAASLAAADEFQPSYPQSILHGWQRLPNESGFRYLLPPNPTLEEDRVDVILGFVDPIPIIIPVPITQEPVPVPITQEPVTRFRIDPMTGSQERERPIGWERQANTSEYICVYPIPDDGVNVNIED